MIEIFSTLLIFVLVLVVYRVWIWPIKTMRNYAKQVANLGYKVKLVPYNPLKYDAAANFQKGI
jgi:hypothetical protein